MAAKWTVTIPNIDLSEVIPDESDLKPHDYPLEAWAADYIHHMLGYMIVSSIKREMKAMSDEELDGPTRKAMLSAYKKETALAKVLKENLSVTRKPGLLAVIDRMLQKYGNPGEDIAGQLNIMGMYEILGDAGQVQLAKDIRGFRKND
jgi:hypothetical protein